MQIGGIFELKKCDPFEVKIPGCFGVNIQSNKENAKNRSCISYLLEQIIRA